MAADDKQAWLRSGLFSGAAERLLAQPPCGTVHALPFTLKLSTKHQGRLMQAFGDQEDSVGLPAAERPGTDHQPPPLFPEVPQRKRPGMVFQRSDWP